MCRPCASVRRKEKQAEAWARWREKNPEYSARKNAEFYAENREREKARARAHRLANPEQTKATTAAWREANRERFAEMKRAYRINNAEKVKAARKARYAVKRERELEKAREWKRANPAKMLAITARRKATKLHATPVWADFDKIEEFYERARNLSAETGIPHHVDHIVPLVSKWVCGLHVHTNLQILTETENQSKSNHRWPGMFDNLGA